MKRAGGGGRSGSRKVERADNEENDSMEITTTENVGIFTSFDSMGLKEDLLRGIYAYGE